MRIFNCILMAVAAAASAELAACNSNASWCSDDELSTQYMINKLEIEKTENLIGLYSQKIELLHKKIADELSWPANVTRPKNNP